ncbi:S-layer homology domain-containing protein [Tepidanaerobacter sp. GT38]|uniref:S-layer homology domain-containing protein n=1 Tax=Tepidanaerobacter sp. GT38 TaxID=2722793 RepID=UPI001F471BBF|nr:S-layer homology domain-containing protein [Tepidanaerobacter sp. GT38]MCG1011396.1 S-layer homology domain-containing protein [Tepidanaerobacter sp. GT38]
MKKYIFLLLAIFISSLFFMFPAFANADTRENSVFSLDNLISKVTVSFESSSYENRYTKYTAKSPGVLRINNPNKLAYVDVYKVNPLEFTNPSQYLYGGIERTPLKWDDITYKVSMYNEHLEKIDTIETKEYPGDQYIGKYEITSGYITLNEPGLYLASSTAWGASSDICLIEILDEGGKPAEGLDQISYRIISLDNFVARNTYSPGAFTDVKENDWFAKNVATCYELGLMEGKGKGKFDPQGNVTIAELFTMAARINKIYNGEGPDIENTGPSWYDGAVYYVISKRIIYGDEFTVLSKPATRAEFAYVLANTLPNSEFKKLNNILSLPDVDHTTKYNFEIFKLYNAGILMGQDKNLTFNPDANISRAEAAAILIRLVKPENRILLK